VINGLAGSGVVQVEKLADLDLGFLAIDGGESGRGIDRPDARF
jgi:hypothetical protein